MYVYGGNVNFTIMHPSLCFGNSIFRKQHWL